MTKSAKEIAQLIHGIVIGDSSRTVEGISSLEKARANTLVWADSEKNLRRALDGPASVIITSGGLAPRSAEKPSKKTFISVKNPRLAFARAVSLFQPEGRIAVGIDSTAQIAPDAELGEDVAVGPYAIIESGARIGARCQIGAHSFIGAGVQIGEGGRIYPRVTLYHDVALGARCVIHSGAVIGSDGFGFVPDQGRYHKFPQVGTVRIGDDVEIGANTTIDRGAVDATLIGRGTKIDNLVQIAHNVEIGEDVVIAAQTGISGGTVIEDRCVIGGQVGMGDHARVKRGAVVGSKGGILPGKIIREGQVVWGIPAIPLDEYKVLNALWRGLPKLKKDVEALRKMKTSGSSENSPKKKSAKKPQARNSTRKRAKSKR
ncbi:MAG: UDP-3-O-(3-hydroxymyristoyl)glucosamine N-acyltransferase [Acidobacteriia bacterium]|nr:UDP-3-O-(3-hydroxymyristoyl)glucosamine N-acyltransferase [Terriglobia bacterium]